MMRSTRREFLRLAGECAAISVLAPRLLPGDEGAGRPGKFNVLFIAVDDLRPQLGCFGHARMKSPNIDRLASGGTVFARTYCQQAVCAPSRASLLSGCRPDTTRVYDLDTPLRSVMPEVLTLPQHFKNNGYTAVSLGKIYHHARRDDPAGWSEPPATVPGAFPGYATREKLDEVERLTAEAIRQGWTPKFAGEKKKGSPTEAGDVPDEAYADGKLAAMAIDALRRLKDGPFFLAVGFFRPHLAFACPKKYWDMYPPDTIDLADNPFQPKGAPDIAMHNWGELRAYHGIPQDGPLSDALARELVRGYYACVSFTDAQIGKVLDELGRLGLADRTIVVLWGDHGWNLGEHGLWCKHSNFETSVHSPLVIRAPGKRGGQTTERLAEFVDIYPTLCDLAGLPLPAHLEGISLTPLMDDPLRPWKKAAFSQYPRSGKVMGYSMRTERYRFTRWQKPDGSAVGIELYDHQTDPHENVNLAVMPEHAKTVAELSAQLTKGWRAALPA